MHCLVASLVWVCAGTLTTNVIIDDNSVKVKSYSNGVRAAARVAVVSLSSHARATAWRPQTTRTTKGSGGGWGPWTTMAAPSSVAAEFGRPTLLQGVASKLADRDVAVAHRIRALTNEVLREAGNVDSNQVCPCAC